jgi:hypothetical protein
MDTYHCPTIRTVPINTIDPSMVVGFYLHDEQELNIFISDVNEVRLIS